MARNDSDQLKSLQKKLYKVGIFTFRRWKPVSCPFYSFCSENLKYVFFLFDSNKTIFSLNFVTSSSSLPLTPLMSSSSTSLVLLKLTLLSSACCKNFRFFQKNKFSKNYVYTKIEIDTFFVNGKKNWRLDEMRCFLRVFVGCQTSETWTELEMPDRTGSRSSEHVRRALGRSVDGRCIDASGTTDENAIFNLLVKKPMLQNFYWPVFTSL